MTALAAGIGHNGGPPLDIARPKLWLPKFEPWRILRPLKMFDGQFYPFQPIQFMDGLLNPVIGAGEQAATVAYLQGTFSASDLTTYTFSTQNIGTPGTDRHICVIAATNGGTVRTISTLTVDGASLALVVGRTNTNSRMEMWFGAVSTANSTGDVVITYSGRTNRCTIAMLECHNIQSATATGTNSSGTNNSAITAANSAGGIAIAAAAVNANGATCGWTGVTDHGDVQNSENTSLSAASAAYASAGTASATPNFSNTTQFNSLIATFR